MTIEQRLKEMYMRCGMLCEQAERIVEKVKGLEGYESMVGRWQEEAGSGSIDLLTNLFWASKPVVLEDIDANTPKAFYRHEVVGKEVPKMTDVSFGDPGPNPLFQKLPTDGRWLVYLSLDMEALDELLAQTLEQWLAASDLLVEVGDSHRLAKDGLAATEAEIRLLVEPDVVGKSKPEREDHRRALIQSGQQWQAANQEFLQAQAQKESTERQMAEYEKVMGVLKARLAWKGRTVGLLTTMPRVPVEDWPAEEIPMTAQGAVAFKVPVPVGSRQEPEPDADLLEEYDNYPGGPGEEKESEWVNL